MFLARIAERSGLLDVLAPVSRAMGRERNGRNDAAREGGNGNDERKVDTHDRNKDGRHAEPTEPSNEKSDADVARKVHGEEEIRIRRIRAQKDEELAAESRGAFAKKQRVKYHHKGTDTVYDAVVVGVHFDDGPDHPYYTIKYSRIDSELGEDGTERETAQEVEKQTTPDRLERVPWDEDATWLLLR